MDNAEDAPPQQEADSTDTLTWAVTKLLATDADLADEFGRAYRTGGYTAVAGPLASRLLPYEVGRSLEYGDVLYNALRSAIAKMDFATLFGARQR